ncbi:MAG: hypothetical protein EP341_05655 [Sphingomonadales bacterium]|nr:MAG: hypothetical protein EP341_05655 [Sphingomonadales bacterium]
MRNYSQAAKRRAKRAKLAGLPELAEVERREIDGGTTRKRRTAAGKREKAPDRVALEARARQMGSDDVEAMRSQALGEAAGMAIHLLSSGDKANMLWGAYSGLTAAEARYHRVVLGVQMTAKVSKIETMPETFEARPDDNPDLRSEDERHRDASNSWASWLAIFNRLSLGERAIIQAVSRGWCEPVKDGKITDRGREFVQAVAALADEVDK